VSIAPTQNSREPGADDQDGDCRPDSNVEYDAEKRENNAIADGRQYNLVRQRMNVMVCGEDTRKHAVVPVAGLREARQQDANVR
jgi:hypothetical protein